MKILVFSDVHGSLNSLKALIETNDWKTADKRIFLGDVCIGCSRPNECIELIDELDCEKILGNNDLYVCGGLPNFVRKETTTEKILQIEYMQNLVTPRNKQIVMQWQKDLSLEVCGKKLYFTHYPWITFKNEENVIDPPQEKNFETRSKMFEEIQADYVFFGHEHRENHFSNGKKYYYCVGTLGLKSPGYYLTIELHPNQIYVFEKHLPFNINEEIDLMDKAGYPYEKDKIKRTEN